MAGIGHVRSADSVSSVLSVRPFAPLPERARFFALLAAWQFSLLAAILVECHRLHWRLLEQGTPGTWSDAPAHDGTWFVPLLLLAPFCWGFPTAVKMTGGMGGRLCALFPTGKQWSRGWGGLLLASLLIGAVSLVAGEFTCRLPVPGSASGIKIRETLPLVQDEFSYLLQARGILAGRWSWPGPEQALELFHQLHVLNEGRFGSRYFPGTGLWIAPWLAMGYPEWAPRVAGAIISIGMFWIGVELGGVSVGWIAGLLTALAPGMAIFNHLQLAHQPGLVGLVLFLYSFLRLMKSGAIAAAAFAGVGLSFAMLCRPLTAAAIGLPFGVWLAVLGFQAFRNGMASGRAARIHFCRMAAAMGTPLVFGLMLMAFQNVQLTGSCFITPYQRYTELYTPRHAFGFHQAKTENAGNVNSRQRQVAYDNWAQDLDLSRATQNSVDRWRGSLSWGLSLIPLLMTVLFMLGTLPWQPRAVQLITASIFCLYLVHVPYWLNGMLEHHYVFEADLLCLLLLAVASVELLSLACRQGRILFPVWWVCLIAASLWMNWVPVGPHGESRIVAGWRPFLQVTAGYRTLEAELRQQPLQKPALVLVTPAASDLHVQFVRNLPPWNAELLIGTARPDLYAVEELLALFPHRTLYHYDSATGRFLSLGREGRPLREEGR